MRDFCFNIWYVTISTTTGVAASATAAAAAADY